MTRNITAFMNLMVTLVPLLLITAVFSRITIPELNLPPASSGEGTSRHQNWLWTWMFARSHP